MNQTLCKRILMWSIIPAFLIGILLCLDLRMLTGAGKLFYAFEHDLPKPISFLWNFLSSSETARLSPAHKLLAEHWLMNNDHSSDKTSLEKRLFELEPENKSYTAYYTQSLLNQQKSSGRGTQWHTMEPFSYKQQKEFFNLLKHGRKFDPENGLYDILEACYLAGNSVKWKDIEEKKIEGTRQLRRNVRTYSLLDRKMLDKAMALYLSALRKPFIKTYSMESSASLVDALTPRQDFFGIIQRLQIFASQRLYSLNAVRSLSRIVVFYGEELNKEKTSSGKVYLQSWRRFLPQLLENNADTLIEVLVYTACAGYFKDAAEKNGLKEDASALNSVCNVVKKWKAKKETNTETVKRHAGFLSSMLIPALHEDVPEKDFAPERKISYLILDSLALTGFCITAILLILIYCMETLVSGISGLKTELLILPGKSYLQIILYGIILPIAVYLVYIHIDFFGGRNFSIQCNMPRLIGGIIFFVLFYPLWFTRVAGKEIRTVYQGNVSKGTVRLNQIFLCVFMLLLTGAVMRPIQNIENVYYVSKDPLFNTNSGFTEIENCVIKKLANGMLEELK